MQIIDTQNLESEVAAAVEEAVLEAALGEEL